MEPFLHGLEPGFHFPGPPAVPGYCGAGESRHLRSMDCSRARTMDPDEWIESSPEFSRGMAGTVREWFLRWEPDLKESIKWNNLCFSGRKLIAGLSACRKHLGIVFFRGTEIDDPAGLFDPVGAGNTAIQTVRVKSLEAMNRDALRSMLHAAVALDAQPALPTPPRVKREPLPVPPELAAALRRDPKAASEFERLSASCQREYIAWVGQAKRPETRDRRLDETLSAVRHGLKWERRREAT